MKHYQISALIKGYYKMKDPKCPSYWRGSGVYDIEVPAWYEVECDVYAHSEEEAIELVEGYCYEDDFRNPYTIITDVVEINDVTFVGEAPYEEPFAEPEYGRGGEKEEYDFWDEVDERYQSEKDS